MMNWFYFTAALLLFAGTAILLLYFRSYFRLSWIGVGSLLLLLGIADFTLPFIRGIGEFAIILLPLLFIPIVYVAPLIGRKKRFADLPAGVRPAMEETAAAQDIWLISAGEGKEKEVRK